jgi:hypothetical protein
MMLPGMEPELPPVPEDGAGGDEWYTPQFILDWLGPIALDPCYSHASLVKAAATIDLRKGEDGLLLPWGHKLAEVGAGIVYANPPFSDTAAWLRRCYLQAQATGRIVVALVPAYPSDGPWVRNVWGCATFVGFIQGRLDFVNPDGRWAQKGRGHALVVYGKPFQASQFVQAVRVASAGHLQAPVWVNQCWDDRDLPW